MLPRLTSSSWTEAFLLPQSSLQLGLQAHATHEHQASEGWRGWQRGRNEEVTVLALAQQPLLLEVGMQCPLLILTVAGI